MPHKKLYRSSTDRFIVGICGGLGEYFDIDPLIFRLLFIILVIFGGSGVLIYIIMWILIPEESTSDSNKGENKMKQEHDRFSYHRSGRGRYIGGLIILIVGVIFLLNNLFPSLAVGFNKLWPVILIIIGLGVLLGSGGHHNYKEDEEDEKK